MGPWAAAAAHRYRALTALPPQTVDGVVKITEQGEVISKKLGLMSIAIRTMVITDRGASVQAGAGIVYDSDPASEDAECYHKASALLSAVPAAERLTRARRAAAGSEEAP